MLLCHRVAYSSQRARLPLRRQTLIWEHDANWRSDPAAGLTGPTAIGRQFGDGGAQRCDDGTASDLHDLLQALLAMRAGDRALPGD